MHRITWDDIRNCEDYRGRWVALDGCRYDEATGQATEGDLVDIDEDLVELCERLREADLKNCAILYVH